MQYKMKMNIGLNLVFEIVSTKLPVAGVDCLLVGGFAVNHYGYTRNTLDVDFMIAAVHINIVRKIMIQSGFTNISVTDNVVFFNAPNKPLRVDFLQVDRHTMLKLTENAETIVIRGHSLKVPSLKDLLAMKLFALGQAESRRIDKDLPDIAYLAIINELDFKAELLPLCRRFATEDIYRQICDKVKSIQSSEQK